MITSKATFSITALACAWLGLAGCDGGWPIDAKTALEAARDKPTDSGKPGTIPDSGKPDGTTAPGCEKPLPPPAPAGEATSCKVALDATGAECKVCFDASGTVVIDGCGGKPDGTSPPSSPIKCDAVTDPATGDLCKTCWAADGTVTASDCAPPAQPGPAPEKSLK